MHHGRADAEVGQLFEYFRRIALGTPAPAFLPRAISEQLRFGEYFQRRRVQPQARHGGRHGDSEAQGTCEKTREIVENLRLNILAAKQVEQQFTASGGLGGEQDARRACLEVRHQFRRRLFGAGIDAHRGRRDAGKILEGPGRLRGPFEGVQLNLLPARVGRQEFRWRQIHLRGVQDRPVPVMAQLFVAFDDTVPQTVQPRNGVVHVHEHAVRRQIFEQVRRPIEEQGQEVFDAAGRDPGTHVAVNGLLRQVAREAQAVAAAELPDRIGIQRRLARRQEFDAVQFVQGALGVRIEAPDAVDIAIQHVDSERGVRTHGKDVDQRTPYRDLAVRDDLRDGGISGQGQLSAQRFQIEAFADLDFEGVGLDVAAGRQTLQQRVDGDQPDTLSGARELRQGGEAAGGDVGMRGEGVVGQRLQIGEHPDAHGAAGKESNFIAQGFRLACALRDDDERCFRARRGLGDGERCRRAVELAPFDDGRLGVGQIGCE